MSPERPTSSVGPTDNTLVSDTTPTKTSLAGEAGSAPTLLVAGESASLPAVSAESGSSLAEGAFDARYETLALLGKGGMGEVHRVQDKRIGRQVALKVLRGEALRLPGLRGRFLREARVQGQLEHPSVVPVYDLGADAEGRPWFTMKRVRGQTLEELLDALARGDAEAAAKHSRHRLLTAFTSVCLAVEYAHARGVLHRDLKPANLMLGDYGEVHVLDWGLARLRDAGPEQDEARASNPVTLPGEQGARATQHGELLGTPGYMSPEQVRGEHDALDARSDVYALGAILFELLTFAPLHDGRTLSEVLVRTVQGVDARASVRFPQAQVPPELEALCVRATATRREERFGSARELQEALERFLEGDRDLQRRRELAAELAQQAQAAARESSHAAEEPHLARTRASQLAARALALDPENAEAAALLARLLLEVPAQTPPEAREELDRARAEGRVEAARVSAVRYLTWLAFLPLLFWMGAREVGSSALTIAVVAASTLWAFWLYRTRSATLARGAVLFVLSTLAIALFSGVVGLFLLVPAFAATNTMFFAMQTSRPLRRYVLAGGTLAILLPLALELLGLREPAYLFTAQGITVVPRMVNLPPGPTQLFLVLSSFTVVLTPALLVGRLRDALERAEERLTVQAWHLRQLVPAHARNADPLAPVGPAEGTPARLSSLPRSLPPTKP